MPRGHRAGLEQLRRSLADWPMGQADWLRGRAGALLRADAGGNRRLTAAPAIGVPGSNPMKWRLVLLASFLFRLGYGLTADFWTEDERQVFLIGLRSYARGEWPFFGADVVWTHSQVPGALLGLLVGFPFRIWAIPEAPVI